MDTDRPSSEGTPLDYHPDRSGRGDAAVPTPYRVPRELTVKLDPPGVSEEPMRHGAAAAAVASAIAATVPGLSADAAAQLRERIAVAIRTAILIDRRTTRVVRLADGMPFDFTTPGPGVRIWRDDAGGPVALEISAEAVSILEGGYERPPAL